MTLGYRGRFAPSPTGPLHFGSLVTALASYLAARSAKGKWLVRIEDVDALRCITGADRNILDTLESFGFEWDEAVVYQSSRTHVYRSILEKLKRDGLAYPCSCSRREAGDGTYPGTCRNGVRDPSKPLAWRVRDEVGGDFVVLRSDGCFAYQLAVVVDDAAQEITEVVRGADLLDSTPRQVHLQQLLGFGTPRYFHVPLVLHASGEKLSKQTRARPIDVARASTLLVDALRFLGQATPSDDLPPGELLAWSVLHWDAASVPRRCSAQDSGGARG